MMARWKEKTWEPWYCWLALAGLTWNMFALDGIVRSYGLFYLELLDVFAAGPQKTGLVATIFAAFGLIFSPVGGWLVDKWSPQTLLLVAPLVYVVGLILSAYSTSLVMVYIGYGAFDGAAHTFCFTATTAAVSKIFTLNLPLASGIMFAGGSIGSMLFPLIFRFLSDEFSFRGALLIYAGIALNMLISAFLLRLGQSQVPKSETREELLAQSPSSEVEMNMVEGGGLDKRKGKGQTEEIAQLYHNDNEEDIGLMAKVLKFARVFCTLKFLGVMLYQFFYMFGLYGFLMYIPSYGKDLELSKIQVSMLLSVCGGCDLFGRLSQGSIANIPTVNIYIMLLANLTLTGIFTVVLPTLLAAGAPVLPLLVVEICLAGGLVGGALALLNQLVVNAVGTSYAGTGLGLTNVSFAFGIGLPPVFFGALKEATGVYDWVPRLCGAAMIFAALSVQLGQRPFWRRRPVKPPLDDTSPAV